MLINSLSNDQLRRYAPSVFATQPYVKMSDSYTFVPTSQVVDQLRGEGFFPVRVRESRTRIEDKQGFTRHQITFRRDSAPAARELGSLMPEIVLTNSHDGASAFKVSAAMMRLVCTNGLMVSAGTMGGMSMRHKGTIDNIIEAAYEVIDQMPTAIAQAESFQSTKLLPEARIIFAETALALRYDEGESPITVAQLLKPRRYADDTSDLWAAFNTVQEHLIKGGQAGISPTTHTRRRTREVKSIPESTRLNQALWSLTARMKELVG